MTQDQQSQLEREKRRRLMTPCLCALILGFLLGAILEAHYRPNYITLEIEPGTTRVNLAPRVNDVINWIYRPEDPKHVTAALVKFAPKNSPCVGTSIASTCVIAKEGSGLKFEYNCVDANPATKIVCLDPGVDPVSTTSPDGFNLFQKLIQSLLTALDFNLRAGTGYSTPLKPMATPTAVTAKSGTASKPSADLTLHPTITCENGTLQVTPNALTQPGDKLTVTPDQKSIYWVGGSTSPFTLTFTDQICTESLVISDPHPPNGPLCTLQSLTPPREVVYTVSSSTMPACGTGSGTISITSK
jgi:hypothetical protein